MGTERQEKNDGGCRGGGEEEERDGGSGKKQPGKEAQDVFGRGNDKQSKISMRPTGT